MGSLDELVVFGSGTKATHEFSSKSNHATCTSLNLIDNMNLRRLRLLSWYSMGFEHVGNVKLGAISHSADQEMPNNGSVD